MNIFLKFQGQTLIVNQQQLKQLLELNTTSDNRIVLASNGKICSLNTQFNNHQTVYAYLPLLGGKGGFGAKLKTEGGKKVRPNDNMYSRDLQGRPVAYTNISKQYEQHLKKKLQDDQKVQKQLADFQVVSNTYKQDYASTRLDSTYNAKIQQNQKRLKDAMKVGMKKYLEKKKQQAIANQNKQKQQQEEAKPKKRIYQEYQQQYQERLKNQQKLEDRQQYGEEYDQKPEEQELQRQQQKQQRENQADKQQQQKQEEQLNAVKRPLQKQQEYDEKQQQKQELPKKIIKPNDQPDISKTVPVKQPQGPVKFMSARQKLKSLFKK